MVIDEHDQHMLTFELWSSGIAYKLVNIKK